jgi:hypothetical protein
MPQPELAYVRTVVWCVAAQVVDMCAKLSLCRNSPIKPIQLNAGILRRATPLCNLCLGSRTMHDIYICNGPSQTVRFKEYPNETKPRVGKTVLW